MLLFARFHTALTSLLEVPLNNTIELLHFTLAKLDFFRCTLQSVANHVTA